MPLILVSVVLCVLIALTVRSRRQARRRILAGSAEGAMPPGATADPGRAAAPDPLTLGYPRCR